MKRAWIVAVLAAALIGLVGVAVWWWWRSPWRYEVFEAHQDALRSTYLSEGVDREPLLGPPREGNAWDEYAVVFGGGPLARDRLVAAARARRAEQPAGGGLAAPAAVAAARSLLLTTARGFRAAARLDEAIDDVAACLQMGADVGRAPYALETGLVTMHEALHELRDVLAESRLTAAQVARIERLLLGLDAQFPSLAAAMERIGYMEGETLRRKPNGRVEVTWRRGFSRPKRAVMAEYGEMWSNYVKVLRRGERTEWSMAEREYEACRRRMLGSENSFFREAGEAEGRRYEWRDCLAHARLLRAAALVRMGRRPDTADWPVDPWTLRPVDYAEGCVWIWADGGRMALEVGALK